jgi:hypothetical protein
MIEMLAPIAVVGAGVIVVSLYLLWRERQALPKQEQLPLTKPAPSAPHGELLGIR